MDAQSSWGCRGRVRGSVAAAAAKGGWLRRRDGQSLAELAICLPLLLVLLMGVADFGRVFYAMISLENAARQGARYAASHYVTDSPQFDDSEAVASADAAAAGFTGATAVAVETTRGGGRAVKVTVQYQFGLLSGLLGIAPFDIQGSAEMAVLEGS